MDSHLVVQLSSVAAELGIGVSQVENVVRLADEGNTVPFITRYRKELTGNLDEENGALVVDLLFALQRARGATLVLVTHDQSLAGRCDRVVRLRSGRVVTAGAGLEKATSQM